jgi:ABC-type dipeptide/oligopeptide/nickel transport system permease subunit
MYQTVLHRPRHWLRRFQRSGLIAMAILLLMFLGCVLTLPWTMGRVEDRASASPQAPGEVVDDGRDARPAGTSSRRYEHFDLDLILLPPSWVSHRPDEIERLDLFEEQAGTRPGYFLGTDRLGRDLSARVLMGGAISLAIGLAAAAISVIIGTLYGTISASMGGRTDAVMMRIVDVLYGLPYVLLVVLLAVAVDGYLQNRAQSIDPGARQMINIVTLVVAIGGVSWLTMARVIRGQVLSLKEQPFMEACRAIGVSPLRQFTRHLLPNLMGPIIVYATLTVPQAILQESFLSFLGIGVQPPLPSWGNLAAEGLSELNQVRMRWWLLLWPCMLLAVTLLSLNFVGEGLRSAFDPRKK